MLLIGLLKIAPHILLGIESLNDACTGYRLLKLTDYPPEKGLGLNSTPLQFTRDASDYQSRYREGQQRHQGQLRGHIEKSRHKTDNQQWLPEYYMETCRH